MSKMAVVYFSASGNTKKVAENLSQELSAELFRIEAKQPYSEEDLNWRDINCRANSEQKDPAARPEIANGIDLADYDEVYLGYPIWWGTLPKIINTFIETGVLNGKTIHAFCTSGSSSIDDSVAALEKYGLDVKDGKRY